ncbi:MAG: response regulator [Anaerolineae bacterium]
MLASQPDGDEAFLTHIADALRHLYDPSALMRSPLGEQLAPLSVSAEARGRFLRTALLEAIESLNPGLGVPFRSPASRSYDALRLHYVEGRTVEEVARELAVSERQAYRDIRKGEADVAAALWERRRPAQQEPLPSAATSLRQEVERLQLSPATASLREAISQAMASVAPLAERLRVSLHLAETPDLAVQAHPAGLRQCLIALLSYAVQCGSERVAVEVAAGNGNAEVHVSCLTSKKPDHASLANLLATAHTLAQTIGAELRTRLERTETRLLLRLPTPAPATILIIDDNEGLLQLFQRYLADSNCRPVGANNATEGLRLARELQPSAIVLDVLMSDTDGWALLGQLKSDPATASTPVVVCSVFNDPQLALALGAAAFISKPVSRAQLLRALAALGLP